MPQRNSDEDFNIYVDPSCLTTPMDDATAPSTMTESGTAVVEQRGRDEELGEPDIAKELPTEPEEHDDDAGRQCSSGSREESGRDLAESNSIVGMTEDRDAIQNLMSRDTEFHEEQEIREERPTKTHEDRRHGDEVRRSLSTANDTSHANAHDDTASGSSVLESQATEHDSSRRQSEVSDRRVSLQTEALIHATAQAVVAEIEARARGRHSEAYTESERRSSADSQAFASSSSPSHAHHDDMQSDTGRRQSSYSSGSQVHHWTGVHSGASDGGGDSSSHHEGDEYEDDVFSDHSPRSSLGMSDAADQVEPGKPTQGNEKKVPRMSEISEISGLSQYDKEMFVPATRETPRPHYRTPSAIRAMHMESPTPSIISPTTPRSSKRHTGVSSSGFPTVSRLGSPTVSAQFSPKGRSTPTRFKPRREAPLVLLHATLLPLRWPWADVLNGLDTTFLRNSNTNSYREKSLLAPSVDGLKALRDAWRQLQDRVGDTVLERGILLPHPQNDYEVLEERLLEALELPLRRRARILECGHYLGPANEMAEDMDESDESDSDYDGSGPDPLGKLHDGPAEKRHWCNTCRCEIKYESLGSGRVFRVKVYASNGLVRAGAWAACWKEMERVDVEIEPIVETPVQQALEHLATMLAEMEGEDRGHGGQEQPGKGDEPKEFGHLPVEEQQVLEDPRLPHLPRGPYKYDEPGRDSSPASIPSPVPARRLHSPQMNASPLHHTGISAVRSPLLSTAVDASPQPIDVSEERRRRDEERLREIYGHSPPRAPITEASPSSATAQLAFCSPVHHEQPSVSYDENLVQEPQCIPSSSPSHGYVPAAPPYRTPPSPSEEAFERRDKKRRQNQNPPHMSSPHLQTASLPELLFEAVKVLLRDRRNLAIGLLSAFVLMLAVRRGPEADLQGVQHRPVVAHGFTPADESVLRVITPLAASATAANIKTVPEVIEQELGNKIGDVDYNAHSQSDPDLGVEPHPPDGVGQHSASSLAVTQREVVRVFETVTETVRVSVTTAEEEQQMVTLDPEALLDTTVHDALTESETSEMTRGTVSDLPSTSIDSDVTEKETERKTVVEPDANVSNDMEESGPATQEEELHSAAPSVYEATG
ncbi:hypothetical protein VTK73DRAFT_1463 [Phialemonium thermophilum]|uniref:Pathway-specific nitrogen regulator n=1 Tax=Phialemonium thermophilum TaxID=223376 RepID=A0ABR3X912_9PEZI